MEKFAGIDLGKEALNFHVVDGTGASVRHGRTSATPQAVVSALSGLSLTRVGVEAGPYGTWLVEGLCRSGLPGMLIETRRMKQLSKHSKVKTDARDAEAIALAMRCGMYTPVHLKSASSRQVRTLLQARTTLVRSRQALQNSVRGLLKDYGVKLKRQSSRLLEEAVRQVLLELDEPVRLAIEPLLVSIATLRHQQAELDRRVRRLAKADPVVRLLMTVPGVGPVVGLAYRATIDDPQRFQDSSHVAAYLGLTPSQYSSGQTDRTGAITGQGDKLARAYLYEAATVILGRLRRPCALRDWGLAVVERRGARRARVAVARKLAGLLHRIWVTGKPFDWRPAA
ncbi:MAG TPA: IS110 family transposase [Reyranellaceae bacterium]|nr:IS110 family transposase [Reyranellaceae bacterium]